MDVIFYDFEVFYKDWMVVIIDYNTSNKIKRRCDLRKKNFTF